MDLEPLSSAPRIPGYRIEAVLGRGATGVVYRARQISVDRAVALKVLHRELIGAQRAERRLQREARATARLAHPNIISAIDMGEVEGVWWYAMELVDGVSLQERIRERPLNEREALRTFIPLVEALQHAFERGVVHRDVKPSNILLERGGRALLVDLGLAFADGDPLMTQSGSTLGTPHYISPEQARDPSQADAQSDIWSLGATMFHAVCGEPPFKGDSVAEILSAVLYAPVPDPADLAPGISKGFALVLRKCLTRDRTLRYQTPAELLADLERVRERRAPNVRRAALEPVARDRRRRVRLIAISALVIGTASVLVWFATRGEHAPAGPTPAPAVVSAPPVPLDPIARLAQSADGPAAELGPALARAVQLSRAQAAGSIGATRIAEARSLLEARLASELRRFESSAEPRFDGLLAERRFDEATQLAASGLRRDFSALVGGASLPADLESELATWLDGFSHRASEARRNAEAAWRGALVDRWRTQLAPEIEHEISAGHWRHARALLTTDLRSWCDGPELSNAGLSANAVEGGIARLREDEVDPVLKRLDARWDELDHALQAWVAARSTELRDALEARTLSDAAGLLGKEWDLELARRNLTVADMPAGLLHLGHEELAKAQRELDEHGRALALQDARRGLLELDDEAQPAWHERRYADAAQIYERASGDGWRAPVIDEIDLRVREARLLETLLRRAADSVAHRNGERFDMHQGTIAMSGKISSSTDPLARGFSLTLDSGRSVALTLRASASAVGGPSAVGREEIEALAALAATPDDRLLRALLRLREGDLRAAREALDSGVLPRDEPLVHEAERRLQAALDANRESVAERRESAVSRYHLALREGREGADAERLKKSVEKLLRDDAEFLTAEQIAELRHLRDERLSEAASPAEPALEEVFKPAVLEQLAQNRVRLRFDLQVVRSGAFDPGAWIASDTGWAALGYPRRDEDMLARAAPTIDLRAPLEVQREPVDVRLRFQPLPDAPAELLLVSCVGFNVIVMGAREGRSARCLVDTTTPTDAVARARAGEGREIQAARAGQAWELRLVLNRARGTALIEIDGRRVLEAQPPVPRGDAGATQLSVRSWEPVKLVTATIEAARR